MRTEEKRRRRRRLFAGEGVDVWWQFRGCDCNDGECKGEKSSCSGKGHFSTIPVSAVAVVSALVYGSRVQTVTNCITQTISHDGPDCPGKCSAENG